MGADKQQKKAEDIDDNPGGYSSPATDVYPGGDISQNEIDMMQRSIEEMEADHCMDRNAALADMRYAFIEKVCDKTVIRC